MKARMSRRWLLWLPLLGASAWLTVFGDDAMPASPPGVVEAVARPAAATQSPSPLAVASSARGDGVFLSIRPREELVVARDDVRPASRDLFAAKSWTPPPAAVPASAPVTPAAPPLPFTFIGKKLEGTVWEVYLAAGDRTYVAREGAVIDGNYAVRRIAPPALEVVYLPLEQTQTLQIGEAR